MTTDKRCRERHGEPSKVRIQCLGELLCFLDGENCQPRYLSTYIRHTIPGMLLCTQNPRVLCSALFCSVRWELDLGTAVCARYASWEDSGSTLGDRGYRACGSFTGRLFPLRALCSYHPDIVVNPTPLEPSPPYERSPFMFCCFARSSPCSAHVAFGSRLFGRIPFLHCVFGHIPMCGRNLNNTLFFVLPF